MCNLKDVMKIVARYDGFPGLGHKNAASFAGVPRTTMRYALQAWNGGLVAPVVLGTISDGRVVGELHALPKVAMQTVGRVELKLNRHLTRERAHSLVTHFRMQASIGKIARMLDRSVPVGVAVSDWNLADAMIRRSLTRLGEIGCSA